MSGDTGKKVQSVMLAMWLGAALLLAAVVAPAAFAVLPSRALAGALVGRVLPIVFASGLVTGVVVAGMEWRTNIRSVAVQLLGVVTAASCAIAQWLVGARIAAIRQAIPGPIEDLAANDPRRIAFGRLHAMSVAWLGLAMAGACVALVLANVSHRPVNKE